jgi:hypothetical protein
VNNTERADCTFAVKDGPGASNQSFIMAEFYDELPALRRFNVGLELEDPSSTNADEVARYLREKVRRFVTW